MSDKYEDTVSEIENMIFFIKRYTIGMLMKQHETEDAASSKSDNKKLYAMGIEEFEKNKILKNLQTDKIGRYQEL